MAAELDENGLASFAHELVDDMPIEVAVVEGEKQRARDGAPQSFNIDLRHFLHLEAHIARQIVKSPIVLFLLQDLVGREFGLLLISFLHLNQSGLHFMILLLFHYKTNLFICTFK